MKEKCIFKGFLDYQGNLLDYQEEEKKNKLPQFARVYV